MCGRYVTPDIAEAERNLLVHLVQWQFRRSYNVAPTQMVPVVRLHDGLNQGLMMRFGLVPFFARGVAPKYSTINATVEKLRSSPVWRGPWKRAQRCLIPATGFYEWHALGSGSKQPYYIHTADQAVFCFAGIWDASRREDGSEILSSAIITLPGNDLLRSIHNAGANPYRMPAILAREQQQTWLEGDESAAEAVIAPYPAELMAAWPVSPKVNSPRNNDASLIDPVAQA